MKNWWIYWEHIFNVNIFIKSQRYFSFYEFPTRLEIKNYTYNISALSRHIEYNEEHTYFYYIYYECYNHLFTYIYNSTILSISNLTTLYPSIPFFFQLSIWDFGHVLNPTQLYIFLFHNEWALRLTPFGIMSFGVY